MSDAADYAAAFKEAMRRVQPDADPQLTYGDGVTADESKDVDAAIVNNRLASTWAASTAYRHGQIVMPTVRNGRRYRVIQAGTSGATEPSAWPTYDYGTVTNGASNPVLTFEDAGAEFPNVYDVRGAIGECLEIKRRKALHYFDLGDARMGQIADRLQEEVRRFSPVGVA